MNANIHELADVQTIDVGEGTRIWQFCVILRGAKIGKNCNINYNVFIENEVIIGDDVTVKPGVQIWDGVHLEDSVFIGPNVTFTNDLLPRSRAKVWTLTKTKVCNGASIGANSTIIAGVKIGKFALIGAGSVVTKDIPDYTLWYGNPAKHKGYITEEGTLLNLDLVDELTDVEYILKGGRPQKR